MKKLFNSLQSRIIISIFAAGIVPIIILHMIVLNACHASFVYQRMSEIRHRCSLISTQLGVYSEIEESMTSETAERLNWYSEAYGGRLLVVDDEFRIVLDTYSVQKGKTCVSDAVFGAFSGNTYEHYDSSSGYLEFVLPVTYSGANEKIVTSALVFSSTTSWIGDSMKRARMYLYFIEGVLVCLLLFVSVYVSYLICAPVNRVTHEIEKLNVGSFNADISGLTSYREIDGIIDSSSQVIRHYQQMEESQEQFVSNVSHELRTPMTSVRVLADSLIGQSNIPEEVYQEFLGDISVEIDRESRIIEDLLSMSRLGKSSDSMHISQVNINEFILDIMRRLKPIAEGRKIELVYESFRQVNADIDEVKLSQAFVNLIENAIKYNRDGGYVKVSLDSDHAYFYLKVADNGIGIPQDALPHIFDRFYRVDKARSRATGGTGLGLSIVRTIILLHYGVIKAESTYGEGTTFTVRIPLTHVDTTGGRV